MKHFWPFVLVTGNANKRREAERVLGAELVHRSLLAKGRMAGDEVMSGPTLETIELDLPELQGLDTEVILRGKAEEAWQRVRRPVVVEETALAIDALAGFPGPLVRWMLESLGAEGIAATSLGLASSLGEQRWAGDGVEASCWLAYRDEACYFFVVGSTRGRLVLPPRGDGGFGWDPVVVPEGHDSTFGELPESAKDEVGPRGRAWRALVDALLRQGLIGE